MLVEVAGVKLVGLRDVYRTALDVMKGAERPLALTFMSAEGVAAKVAKNRPAVRGKAGGGGGGEGRGREKKKKKKGRREKKSSHKKRKNSSGERISHSSHTRKKRRRGSSEESGSSIRS